LKLQAIASQHDWKRDWMNGFHHQSLSKHHNHSRKQSGCDDMKIGGFDDWAHRVIFALDFNNAIVGQVKLVRQICIFRMALQHAHCCSSTQ
jgi:hypothetical protein